MRDLIMKMIQGYCERRNIRHGKMEAFWVVLALLTLISITSCLESVAYTMREEQPMDYFVGDIKSDADLINQFSAEDYDRLVFSILSPVDGDVMSGNYFQVDESTGILTVLNPLDRDHLDVCAFMTHCVITFDVAVGPEDIFRVISVRVEIEDVNDNSPQFGLSEIKLNISELAAPGSSYQLPVVSDQDGDSFGVSKMRVSPASGQFAVRWMRGSDGKVQPRLALLEPVDREEVTNYDLSITASDGGSPPRTAILLVHVDILDANDNMPVFESAGYEVSVPEDGRPGTSLIKVHAEDPDHAHNGEVTYTMDITTRDQYGELFQVSESTGIVTLQGGLNREELDVYYLTVVAEDRGEDGRTSSATVTVYVEDKNDNSPTISITTLTDSGVAHVTEAAEEGTFVALLSVKDQDWGRNADVTCTLNTGDFRLEALQANKFTIVTGMQIDREVRHSYTIEVFCHDHGVPQKSSAAMVTVQVDDVNDNSPSFAFSDVTVHVTENSRPGTVIGEVQATDADHGENGRVTYSTADMYNTHISVDDVTGVISTISSIDREAVETFTVYIIARDNGTPALSATATVTVIVDDVNDMVPAFTQPSYTFVVTENENKRRELARLTATDRDGAPYNSIRYSLRGPDAYFLEINPDNGTLFAVKPLDRESVPFIAVQVVATDQDNPAFIGLSNVTIYIGDVNDHMPRIIFPSATNSTIEISSQLGPDDTVGWLQAVDGDSGQNAVLEYFLTFSRPEDADLFSVDSETGLISVLEDLTSIDQKVIRCVAVVKDGGIPSLVASVNFTIVINSTLALPVPSTDDEADKMNITIVIVVVAATLVLAAILIGAIIFVFRRMKRRRSDPKPRYTVEKMGTMVAKNGQIDLEKQHDYDGKDLKTIIKIYDPKSKEMDRESLGSGEGSTTDSGRGASEEGEHGDHDRSVSSRHNDSTDAKSASVFPCGADDSILTGHLDLSTSFELPQQHATLPRRAHKGKNVTFEEDVLVAEISDSEQHRYSTPQRGDQYPPYSTPVQSDQYQYSPYDSCPAISYPSSTDNTPYSGSEAWSPDSEYSSTMPYAPRRTVRNVKAKDRSKRLDSLAAMHANVQTMQSEPNICQNYDPTSNRPYDFTDSNSLLKYKMHGTDDSTSEVNSASTTSGSYIIQTDDLQCDCGHVQ